MFRSFVFLSLLAGSVLGGHAQSNSSPQPPAQSKYVKKGDRLMANFRFEKAAAMYKKAADKNAADMEAWEKLGSAFLMSDDKVSAEAIYKILSANPAAKPINKFYYAQVLRGNGKYPEADAAYKTFAQASPTDPRGWEFKNFAADVKSLAVDSKIYELSNLPENTEASELGPEYNAGKLVFSSNRGAGSGIRVTDFWSGRGFYDLYEQRSAGADEVVKPEKMKGKVNKRLNEGPATFTRDGMEMIFTRTNYKEKGPGGSRKLGLYHADFDGAKNRWINIQPLPFNSPAYNVAHPSISKDGKKLYFISDMPGGWGQTDIYMSVKNGSTWEQPVNLGTGVNTLGREMFPFIADNGTLYFSSDSRVGLGGLDIYSANLVGGKWSNIQNPGAPVNSVNDDFGYVSDETGKYGFIVSDRPGGAGGDDIYKFTRKAEPVCGTVVDAKTKNTIEKAMVTLTADGGDQHRTYSNAKGDFCLNLEPGKTFGVAVQKDGYGDYTGTISVKALKNEHKIIELEPHGGIDLTVDVAQKDGGELAGAVAFLINKKTGEIIQQKSDSTGKVKFDLFKDQEYDLKVTKKVPDKSGLYDKFIKTISTMGFTPSQKLTETAQLNYYDGKVVFDLPNVFFDYNSSKIKPAAAADLDKVVSVMKTFPDMQIELSAHTDSRGKADVNMVMSGKRAQACVDYLSSKGADITHIIAIGYGEEKIRNRCVDEVPCSDAEHAVNRRVEFKVVKFD